jgi:hypothetical protein
MTSAQNYIFLALIVSCLLPSNRKLNKTTLKVAHLSRIYCHTKFQDPILSSTNVAVTAEVRTAASFVLLTAGNEKHTNLEWFGMASCSCQTS